MQCLYFICEFYPHTHVKITRQWKSTLRLATCIVKLVIIKDYWSALVMSFKISKPFLSKRNWKSSSWTLRFIHRFKLPLCLEVFFPVKMSYVQTDATTPNIVAPTMLGVYACVLAVVCKRMQQPPTMLGPAVHVGRIKPISLCKPCLMSVRGPNNVGRAV